MTKRKQNIAGEYGATEARELTLYIDNDGELYERSYIPIVRNLVRKMERGTYDSARAPQAFSHLVEAGAKKYAREFARPADWHRIFNTTTRRRVAEEYARRFERQYAAGEFDYLKGGRARNQRHEIAHTHARHQVVDLKRLKNSLMR